MNIEDKKIKLIATALYQIKILLSNSLGSDNKSEQPVREAAHLAYALHNECEKIIEGSDFEYETAIKRIKNIDKIVGSNFSEIFLGNIKN